METNKPIEALAADVIESLKKLNYAHNTVCSIRASFNRICAFARVRNERCLPYTPFAGQPESVLCLYQKGRNK